MKQKQDPNHVPRGPVEPLDPPADRGLTRAQVNQRREMGWDNRSPEPPGQSEREIILSKIVTFFNLVFLVLAVVLVLVGSSVKNMTFLVVAAANTVIGIVQQIRAKRAVDRLTLVAAQPVTVIREGAREQIPSRELVRDDIVLLAPGNQICADGRVRRGSLRVNESLITGEADPVEKGPGDPVMSGSFVISGRAAVQLTRVGADAFAARLSAEAKANPQATKSEMMRALDRLIQVVGIALIPVGMILFHQEYRVLGLPLRESGEAVVAALVGMIPEGLYLLTSVAMAVSALKLTGQRVLVQDMNCIETLAMVDVLCVDKTGTITEAAMEVDELIPLGDASPEKLEAVLGALFAPEPENDTARAVKELFDRDPGRQCTRRIPFDSEKKWSGAEFDRQGAFLVGAPEFLMGSGYASLRDRVEAWSGQGYRVLLCAGYDGAVPQGALDPQRLRPMAALLLTSRIRETATETFRYFDRQGVAIKVISGDNPVTVSQVALRAGIAGAEAYVDASTLGSPQAIREAVQRYTVFGRVTPDRKRELIAALKAQKHTVAMTGDGVNDVLAMKEAHCGIAMASGAQAASQVAQLVLLDSDFAAMPGIVGEGRRVINNIQRSAALFLVKNIFSLGLALISLFTDWPYPLQPIHLSVISALTIGVPSFFLAMEPNYERVRGRFLPGVLRRAFPGGLTNIFVVLMAQAFMAVFGLTLEETSTVSAAILGVVGLLVLFQVCKPFDRFRQLIWLAMTLALVVCFTVLDGLFDLHTGNVRTALVMANLLLMTPTVFFTIQRIFDWGDRGLVWLRSRLSRRPALPEGDSHADI